MNICIYITALILALHFVENEAANVRTVGDFKASHITQFPFEVSIRRRFCDACTYEHYCSGTIYSQNVIITAASCVRDASVQRTQVIAGTSKRTTSAQDGQVYLVDKITLHENNDIDIALLHLSLDLKFNGLTIAPVKLATQVPIAGKKAVVAGWGQLNENVVNFEEDIKAVQVPIMDLNLCKETYFWTNVKDTEICAGYLEGGVDACLGDAGSPLLVDNEMVGIVSWGYGCARPNNPGVYTNVVMLRNWIQQYA
ncbi:trypsin eta-like [Lucilia sericata]|uniref:trypsin eta-like n=1 Tax=Lucilia sericata TaxID=13632 RepID=UPI0018A7EE9C|nr:trypsin eta-like [Lucilia sericata]